MRAPTTAKVQVTTSGSGVTPGASVAAYAVPTNIPASCCELTACIERWSAAARAPTASGEATRPEILFSTNCSASSGFFAPGMRATKASLKKTRKSSASAGPQNHGCA